MNISELSGIADWIESEIVEAEILQKYRSLQKVLAHNARGNTQKEPFEEQRRELTDSLEQVDLPKLTIEQLSFVEQIGLTAHLGPRAAKTVEDNLVRNQLDLASAANRIQISIDAVASAIERVKDIKAALRGCEMEGSEVRDGILVRIGFHAEASIENVVDFRDWARIWHQIGFGVALAHGDTAENVRVIGAGKGSVIIELAVTIYVARTLGRIVLWGLEVTERVGRIRKQAHETRSLALQNEEIAAKLDDEADLEKAQGAESILAKVIEELKIDRDSQNELIQALKLSVEQLIGFLDKGGDLDCLVPDEGQDSDDASSRLELRQSFTRIRELRAEQRAIEDGTTS